MIGSKIKRVNISEQNLAIAEALAFKYGIELCDLLDEIINKGIIEANVKNNKMSKLPLFVWKS